MYLLGNHKGKEKTFANDEQVAVYITIFFKVKYLLSTYSEIRYQLNELPTQGLALALHSPRSLFM